MKLDVNESDLETTDSVRGLFWSQPLLALILMIALLSLAGIPLTAGFVGKFYIFTVGIKGAVWFLIAALVIGSGIGIYYYLRIIFAMTEQPNDLSLSDTAVNKNGMSVVATLVVCLLIFMMLYLGVLPQPLIEQIGNLY